MGNNQPAFENGKICYIELPSRDINESAAFYTDVFGWNTFNRGNGVVSFNDSVNQVSGSFRNDRQPVTATGSLIYIMVTDIKNSIKKIKEHGGVITQPVGMDAPEITARFSDPTGNIFGLYQDKH